MVALLVSLLLMGFAEELWVGFVPKYLEAMGAGVLVWTAYQAIKDLLDALYQYPGGVASDRLGRKRSLILFTSLATAGYALYLAGRHWSVFLIGTLLVAAWGSMSLPTTFALIGDSLEPGRRSAGFSLQSIVKRLPILIAPVLGGWLLLARGTLQGFRIALGITLALAVATLAVQSRMPVGPHRPEPAAPSGPRQGFRFLRPELRRLLVSDTLARLAEGIPAALIVVYSTTNLGASLALYGGLRGLQMLVSIAGYVPAGKLADRFGQAPFVALTFAFFGLYPLAFALHPALSGAGVAAFLVGAAVLAGLREFGEPARKALIVDLVDARHRGEGVGAYYLARGLCVAPAPLVGGALWLLSPRLPFAAAAAAGLAGLAFYLWRGPRRA